jgi:hypothetical protein
MVTAYEHFLFRNAIEQCKFDDGRYSISDYIASFLINDCKQQNPQAFKIVGRTGDVSYTKDTFIKAANMIIDSVKNNHNAKI